MSISSNHWARGRVHPGQSPVHYRATWRYTGKTTMHIHTLTPNGNLERPINLIGMFSDCGRKEEEGSHTCELHVETPKIESQTQYLLILLARPIYRADMTSFTCVGR